MENEKSLSKEDLKIIIDQMIEGYEKLPPHALHSYATNYDLMSVLLLIKALFNS